MCDTDNLQNCCRTCLDMESQHVSIVGNLTICLHLKTCLGVTVSSNDHLPKSICVSCVSLLNQFYNFQLNARCSQDWLESSVQEKLKKSAENKMLLQPLPDSEYNSDSLLEFLNNTENIEEYLNNLGKEDVPCIVNMVDKNDCSVEMKSTKIPSPSKHVTQKKFKPSINDSEFQIVKGIVAKDVDKLSFVCLGCKIKCDSVQKLLQHMSTCETSLRTCKHCHLLFDSKQQMQQHSLTHNTTSFSCNCGEQFSTKDKLVRHHRTCLMDYATSIGCVYRCKECGDTFTERVLLYKHAKEHVLKAQEKVCDVCGHKFNGIEALNKHRHTEHEIPENVKYRCKVCSLILQDRKQMYQHVKDHTAKPQPTRHLCETCGLSFATHTSLLRHCSRHAIKQTCNICKKQFRDSKALEVHINEHKEMSICEKCGQSVDIYQLNVHRCE